MASSTEKSGCLPSFLRSIFGSNTEDFGNEVFPYRLRDDFLSPTEASLFYALQQVVGDQALIMAKVRLADLFFVPRANGRDGSFNRISQKHIDFLVCHAKTVKPLCGIELDDSSHNSSKRQTRDDFVNQVFATAQLPLVRITAQRSYDRAQLAAQLMPYLAVKPVASPNIQPQAAASVQNAAPICPKCGVQMVLRTVKNGQNAGQQFYGCSNYPRCREMAKA
jgi:hypothetical protein